MTNILNTRYTKPEVNILRSNIDLFIFHTQAEIQTNHF